MSRSSRGISNITRKKVEVVEVVEEAEVVETTATATIVAKSSKNVALKKTLQHLFFTSPS